MHGMHSAIECDGVSQSPQSSENKAINVESTTPAVCVSQTSKTERVRVWAVPMILFVIGCCFSIPAIVNAIRHPEVNKDYAIWYRTGRSVLAGEPLYERQLSGETEYMYPPTAGVLFYAPLSILNPVLFVVVLGVLNAASWGFSVWAAATLVKGKWDGDPFVSTLVPGLAIAPYVYDIQLLGQLNLLLLAMTLGAFVLLRNRHSLIAAWLFGTAVAMKAFPLPAIAYFVVRRKWLAAVASIITVIAMVWLIPGIVRGLDRNTRELKQWAGMMIGDQSGNTMAARSVIGFTRRNQSLIAVSHRLLRHVDAGNPPHQHIYVNFADVSPKVAQIVGYGTCLLLGFVLLLAARFHFGPTSQCEGLEVAMVCTLVPLCSPLAWTYFFCWLLPGWMAVLFSATNPDLAPQVRRLIKIGGVTAALLIVSAVTEQIDPTLQAYGVTAFGSVVLFLTLAYARFHLPDRVTGAVP